jgi:hypothetical protein
MYSESSSVSVSGKMTRGRKRAENETAGRPESLKPSAKAKTSMRARGNRGIEHDWKQNAAENDKTSYVMLFSIPCPVVLAIPLPFFNMTICLQ